MLKEIAMLSGTGASTKVTSILITLRALLKNFLIQNILMDKQRSSYIGRCFITSRVHSGSSANIHLTFIKYLNVFISKYSKVALNALVIDLVGHTVCSHICEFRTP